MFLLLHEHSGNWSWFLFRFHNLFTFVFIIDLQQNSDSQLTEVWAFLCFYKTSPACRVKYYCMSFETSQGCLRSNFNLRNILHIAKEVYHPGVVHSQLTCIMWCRSFDIFGREVTTAERLMVTLQKDALLESHAVSRPFITQEKKRKMLDVQQTCETKPVEGTSGCWEKWILKYNMVIWVYFEKKNWIKLEFKSFWIFEWMDEWKGGRMMDGWMVGCLV